MKRDPQPQKLSREQHGALRLAKLLRLEPTLPVPPHIVAALVREQAGLTQHFAEEERDLLPQLLAFGEQQLADRLLAEHQEMLALCQQLDNVDSLNRFGSLLQAHVRFEEREMFEVLQRHWATRDATGKPLSKAEA